MSSPFKTFTMSHETIAVETIEGIETFFKSSHHNETFKDINSLDAIDGFEATLSQQDVEVQDANRQYLTGVWIDLTFETFDKYNMIVDNLKKVNDDFVETKKFINEAKVPFCWELTRLNFLNIFEELGNDFCSIDIQLAEFPDSFDFHRAMIIHKADKSLSESAITFLQNTLSYYADRISHIEDEYTRVKKSGLECFAQSQQIINVCGDLEF